MKGWALAMLILASGTHAAAQCCPQPQSCPPARRTRGEPWPDEVLLASDDRMDWELTRLSPADGEAIRCALIAAMNSPLIQQIDPEFHERARRRVGALRMRGNRPLIGAFRVKRRRGGGGLELEAGLRTEGTSAYSLIVQVAQEGGVWRVTSLRVGMSIVRMPRP
ncbi:MAG: hypothetical protein AAGE52_06090 [Myxococcota bacterium]